MYLPQGKKKKAEHSWRLMTMLITLPSHSCFGTALKAYSTFPVSSFLNYFTSYLFSNFCCHFSSLHSVMTCFPFHWENGSSQKRTSTYSPHHIYGPTCIGPHVLCLTFHHGWMSVCLSKSSSSLLCSGSHPLTFSRISLFQIYPLFCIINFPTPINHFPSADTYSVIFLS